MNVALADISNRIRFFLNRINAQYKMMHAFGCSINDFINCVFYLQFVRFANIEEDTPSYHRRYDFFISKFSSMCHGNHENVELRDSIRVAGIRGLQGVIRKTVSDDLVENIWDKQHMEKIVPSLLFNMQNMVKYL